MKRVWVTDYNGYKLVYSERKRESERLRRQRVWDERNRGGRGVLGYGGKKDGRIDPVFKLQRNPTFYCGRDVLSL